MQDTAWIWQHPEWPRFTWQSDTVAPLLRRSWWLLGVLTGRAGAAGELEDPDAALNTLLSNIITSSAIEGERLDAQSVRSSLAKRLGLRQEAASATSKRSEGLAAMMLDAVGEPDIPLTHVRIFQWHRWLFPGGDEVNMGRLRPGQLRGHEPMQVVSGRIDRPTVHFQAPPREGLEQELDEFLAWFSSSAADPQCDPLLRAALAHLWFVTLHPFEDGNGRLTRAITDLALAQADRQTIRLYAMSAGILERRTDYYGVLERTQRNGMDVTPWIVWFLQVLEATIQDVLDDIDRTLLKTRYWHQHRATSLCEEQAKVLNRLLDSDDFHLGISAAKYRGIAGVSKATATRHLADLVDKGCLERMPGGGRNTRYQIKVPD